MFEVGPVLASIAMRLGVSSAQALGRKALPRAAEPVVKVALEAYEAAAADVLQAYGDRYGTVSTSFLASQGNLDRALLSAWAADQPLRPQDLDGAGFDGVATAPHKMLADFIAAFEARLRSSPLLADVLTQRELAARAKVQWEGIRGELEALRDDLAPRPLIGQEMPAGERARWIRYLHTTAERYAKLEDAVLLDVVGLTTDIGTGENSDRRPFNEVAISGTVLVTGPPGAGKSSLVGRLVRRAAFAAAAGPLAETGFVDGQPPVPVVVRPGSGSFFDRIAHALHSGGLGGRPLTADWVREALAAGILWVIVDDAHRLDVMDSLADLLDYSAATDILILGRETPALLDMSLPRGRLARLSMDQQDAILRRHLEDPGRARSVLYDVHREGETKALAERPQTLVLLASAIESQDYRLARDKRELFARAFERRVRSGPARTDGLADPVVVRRLLGAVALKALRTSGSAYAFSAALARKEVGQVVAEMRKEGEDLTRAVVLAWLRERHILVETESGDGILRFEHDQWHEFFAADELLRRGETLGTIPPTDARREIALFLATAADLTSTIEKRDFWNAYWEHLARENLLFAFLCLRRRKDRYLHGRRFESIADVSRFESQYPPLSEEERWADFERYLHVYRDAVERHVPKIKGVLDPKAEGRIGFRVGGAAKRLSTFGGTYNAFVALEDGAPELAAAEDLDFEYRGTGVTRVGQLHSYDSFPSQTALAPVLAIRHLSGQLEKAWSDEALWEPDDLLIERAYAEGAALYGALTKGEEPAPPTLEVEPLIRELEQTRVSYWRCDVPYAKNTRTGSRKVRLDTWKSTLDTLRDRGLQTDCLGLPTGSPRALISHLGDGALTENEVAALKDWSLNYYTRLYETVWDVLHETFPTSVMEIPFARRSLPASVILCPGKTDPLRPEHRYGTVYMGSRWWGRSKREDAPKAEARWEPSYVDAEQLAGQLGTGWWVGSWFFSVKEDWMPLRSGLYHVLRSDMDAIFRV